MKTVHQSTGSRIGKTIVRAYNIHDTLGYRYDGSWYFNFYNNGKCLESTNHTTWVSALAYAVVCCSKRGVPVKEFDSEAWTKYYQDCQKHIDYMMARKGNISESEWQMSFSCDAPNKPNYERANND